MKLFKKDNLKRVIGLILVTALLVAVAPINTEAAVSSGRTVAVKNPFSSMTFTANAGDTLVDLYRTKSSADPEKELAVQVKYSYTQNDRLNDGCGRVFPINVSSGGTFVITSNATEINEDTYMGLYFDSECQNKVGYGTISGPRLDGTYQKKEIQVPKKGTYYLKVYSYSSTYFRNSITMNVAFYTSSSISLSANKVYAVGCSSSTVYYKITVPYTANVTIMGNDNFSYALCNASKRVLYDYLNIDKTYNFRTTQRLAKGTYYIKIDRNSAEYGYYKIKYTYAVDPTLKNGSYTTIYPALSKQNNYVKIRPTVDGYVTVNLYKGTNYDYSGDITLLNSSAKAISETEWVYAANSDYYKAVFAVKKNTTYYLRLTGVNGKTAIRYTQTRVAEKSGATKAKAVTVSRNKAISGTLTAGSNQADWYKVKLTKKQVLKMYTTANCSGKMKLQVYYSNGKKLGWDQTVAYSINQKGEFYSTTKLAKGTYYIKIYKYDSLTTGNYTLKWK